MTARRGSGDEEALAGAFWLLVADAGHATCDGWTFEEREGVLRCRCGEALYACRRLPAATAQDPDGAGSRLGGTDAGAA